MGETCKRNGCTDAQEFPGGKSNECLEHALETFFDGLDHENLDYKRVNALKQELKGTWGKKAVKKTKGGEVVDYYALNENNNNLHEYWPDYFDEPAWTPASLQGWMNDLRYGCELEIVGWDETPCDENAEIIYPV